MRGKMVNISSAFFEILGVYALKIVFFYLISFHSFLISPNPILKRIEKKKQVPKGDQLRTKNQYLKYKKFQNAKFTKKRKTL